MQHEEIVSRLSQITGNPKDVIFSVTINDVIIAIAHRIAEKSLTLSAEDLLLAMDVVKEAIDHHLDIREYIEIGLDVWMITRKL